MASKRVGLPVPTVGEWMLECAGLTRERMGKLVARAVEKSEEQLDATQVKVFQSEGIVLYSEPLTDHATQGKAAERLLRHFLPHVNHESQGREVYVLPDWAYGEDGIPSDPHPLPVPPVSDPPPSGYLSLHTWAGIVPFPTHEYLGVGGKNAGPLSGVHEPCENFPDFETVGPEFADEGEGGIPTGGSHPTSRSRGSSFDSRGVSETQQSGRQPRSSGWGEKWPGGEPDASNTAPSSRESEGGESPVPRDSLFTDQDPGDDPGFSWLDEVRR